MSKQKIRLTEKREKAVMGMVNSLGYNPRMLDYFDEKNHAELVSHIIRYPSLRNDASWAKKDGIEKIIKSNDRKSIELGYNAIMSVAPVNLIERFTIGEQPPYFLEGHEPYSKFGSIDGVRIYRAVNISESGLKLAKASGISKDIGRFVKALLKAGAFASDYESFRLGTDYDNCKYKNMITKEEFEDSTNWKGDIARKILRDAEIIYSGLEMLDRKGKELGKDYIDIVELINTLRKKESKNETKENLPEQDQESFAKYVVHELEKDKKEKDSPRYPIKESNGLFEVNSNYLGKIDNIGVIGSFIEYCNNPEGSSFGEEEVGLVRMRQTMRKLTDTKYERASLGLYLILGEIAENMASDLPADKKGKYGELKEKMYSRLEEKAQSLPFHLINDVYELLKNGRGRDNSILGGEIYDKFAGKTKDIAETLILPQAEACLGILDSLNGENGEYTGYLNHRREMMTSIVYYRKGNRDKPIARKKHSYTKREVEEAGKELANSDRVNQGFKIYSIGKWLDRPDIMEKSLEVMAKGYGLPKGMMKDLYMGDRK